MRYRLSLLVDRIERKLSGVTSADILSYAQLHTKVKLGLYLTDDEYAEYNVLKRKHARAVRFNNVSLIVRCLWEPKQLLPRIRYIRRQYVQTSL